MKVLKIMSEITGRMDMNEFAAKAELTTSQTMERVQELAKNGFVKKVGSGYAMTEKGKNALKALAPVTGNMRFNFYVGIGQPANASAGSAKEFREVALKVNLASLEFHLHRGDFENWFRTSIKDTVFADTLANLKKSKLKGEELRESIRKALETRYSL